MNISFRYLSIKTINFPKLQAAYSLEKVSLSSYLSFLFGIIEQKEI